MTKVHNHGIDPMCIEFNTPEGLKGECMFPEAAPPENVKGLATEEELLGLQSKLKPLDDSFREQVQGVLYPLEDLLVKKNASYGDAALNPVRIFSKASAEEQIRVRLDDKLSRLYHGKEYGDEDTITDLMGYLVLLKIAQKEKDSE